MKRYLYAGYAHNTDGKREFRCSNRADYGYVLRREGKFDIVMHMLPQPGLSRAEAKKLVDQMQKSGFSTAEQQLAHNSRPVERVNLLTGEKYTEAADTPLCCSPSSETYWSM